ncbi:hypothetical protein V2J09_009418 [Rumex salicifolius]
MESLRMKALCMMGMIVVLGVGSLVADGAGECGRVSPDQEAFKMAPCAMAGQDESASVSDSCCAQVKRIGQNPACLCAVLLSNTAKSSGVNPGVAITIPKRCNFANRPVGYNLHTSLKEFQHGWET